jgi:ribosomal protein S4
MIGERVVTIPSYTVKIDEEPKIRLTVESQFNQTLSKPESDLGSPETENLEIKSELTGVLRLDTESLSKSEVEKPAEE